jgi:hypothetical protein
MWNGEPSGGTLFMFLLILNNKDWVMLQTIAFVMVLLWLLGLITSTTMGGFIHVLLVVALVLVLVSVIRGPGLTG